MAIEQFIKKFKFIRSFGFESNDIQAATRSFARSRKVELSVVKIKFLSVI